MKPKIFVTRLLPPLAMDRLQKEFSVTFNPDDRPLSKGEIIAGAKAADALLCLLTDTIDDEMISACSHLRVISNYAVGFNNIDVASASRHKIPVCTTPGVLTDSTADLTFALILAVARRIVEGDSYLRAGQFTGWAPQLLLGADVHHKKLGIVGLGRIGRAVARRALGFEMEVLFTHHRPESEPGCRQVELDELLTSCDFVTLHLPLTKETHHLIDRKALGLMKRTAFLINTGRGPLIDEKALVEALRFGEIAGAGLDVFEREPEVEQELLAMEQCVLLPHLGSSTLETRTQMGILAADNALAIFQGKKPYSIINPEILSKFNID